MKQLDRSVGTSDASTVTAPDSLFKGNNLDQRLQQLPSLAKLLALWRSKCTDDNPPSWKDFDVFELRPWMGHLNVVDVTAAPFGFRYRIFGSDLSATIGAELTGRNYEDLKELLAAEIAGSYRAVVADPQPALVTHSQPAWHGRNVTFDRLLLPMQADDHDGSRVVLVGAYVTKRKDGGQVANGADSRGDKP